MSAVLRSDGTVAQYAGRSPRVEQLTPRDAADPEKLARAFNELRAEVLELAKSEPEPWIDFEDLTVTSGTNLVLPHGMGGRVRYAVLSWKGGIAGPWFEPHSDTTDNELHLTTSDSGTATIRVWLAT